MSAVEWLYASASVTGTSHVKLRLPCQDSNECGVMRSRSGESVWVAIASDGAGSAKHSDEGAAHACRSFMKFVDCFFRSGKEVKHITKDFATGWLRLFQSQISAMADEKGLIPRDFACTVLAAIVGTDFAAFFQVGDGAIVIPKDEEDYDWIFWPNKGEFENTTFFATEPSAFEQLNFETALGPIAEVAIFTDGLQHLALTYKDKTVYKKFFKPLFNYLHSLSEHQKDTVNASLCTFLDNVMINSRTDDDKTLVLAVRRGGF